MKAAVGIVEAHESPDDATANFFEHDRDALESGAFAYGDPSLDAVGKGEPNRERALVPAAGSGSSPKSFTWSLCDVPLLVLDGFRSTCAGGLVELGPSLVAWRQASLASRLRRLGGLAVHRRTQS